MRRKFHLDLGEPYVVGQGTPNDVRWGQIQFPIINVTKDGEYYATWEYSLDTIYYEQEFRHAVSKDGKTWTPCKERTDLALPIMAEGNRVYRFVRRGAHKIDYYEKYQPAVTLKNGSKLFFASDIEETEDKTVYGIELGEKPDETRTFECKINWPYKPVMMPNSTEVYPLTTTFSLCETAILPVGKDLYLPVYARGFDCEATDREKAITPYPDKTGVYVFRSSDGGRTWDYTSQILVTKETYNEDPRFEGFDEPYMEVMPDGSLSMLIRTGSGLPSYIVHSTDGAKTWTKPEKFDEIGVLPQLKTLKCGVTLASYGRPIVKVRATADPSGQEWEEPIVVPFAHERKEGVHSSCCYTRLLAVSDTEALLLYSDFKFPNADGVPVKTILCRKITVVFEE